jgi:hypothetical protein
VSKNLVLVLVVVLVLETGYAKWWSTGILDYFLSDLCPEGT